MFCCEECRRAYNREARAEKRRLWKMQRARKVEENNGKPSSLDEVNKILKWIEKHYQETGVLLSYGKAVAFMQKGV